MKINQKGINLLHEFEGLRLEAYECQASKRLPPEKKFWTIGYGNTYYESGRKVKQGDVITKERAERLFLTVLQNFEISVRSNLKVELNENQFSALVSFTYNVGVANLKSSTLLKKVNKNPNDSTIFAEFLRWVNAGGKPSNGLLRRRQAEANLYYEPVN